jgi:hypothetical protein
VTTASRRHLRRCDENSGWGNDDDDRMVSGGRFSRRTAPASCRPIASFSRRNTRPELTGASIPIKESRHANIRPHVRATYVE